MGVLFAVPSLSNHRDMCSYRDLIVSPYRVSLQLPASLSLKLQRALVQHVVFWRSCQIRSSFVSLQSASTWLNSGGTGNALKFDARHQLCLVTVRSLVGMRSSCSHLRLKEVAE
jgi:hypothetical protein